MRSAVLFDVKLTNGPLHDTYVMGMTTIKRNDEVPREATMYGRWSFTACCL